MNVERGGESAECLVSLLLSAKNVMEGGGEAFKGRSGVCANGFGGLVPENGLAFRQQGKVVVLSVLSSLLLTFISRSVP